MPMLLAFSRCCFAFCQLSMLLCHVYCCRVGFGECFLNYFIAQMEDHTVAGVEGFPGWDFTCDLEVDYGSELHASIVYAALGVDKELQPDKVKRQMSVCDGILSVHFEAVEARFLRASFSSFVDLVTLATKTIEEFGMGDVSLIAKNM